MRLAFLVVTLRPCLALAGENKGYGGEFPRHNTHSERFTGTTYCPFTVEINVSGGEKSLGEEYTYQTLLL